MRNIPTVPAMLFSTTTTALDNLGVSSERVVEKAGLPLWQYLEPQAKVPGIHFFQLLGHCARTYGEETFGLRIAQDTPMTSLGLVGRRLSQCLTVHDAIKTIARLVPQLQNTSTMSISEGDEEVWLLRKRVQVADSGYRQVEISTLSWMIDVVRLGAGPDWQPAKICLEAKSVPGLGRLETFANTEVRFEQGMTGLAIPRSLLSRRIPTSRSSTAAAEDAEPSYEPPAAEFLVSLRQILRSFLTFGHPRIEMIAEILGVNVRTLQRRLSEEGLTFKKVVDQARYQAAGELMSQPEINLAEVAHELGYSDQAHFNRAFRRWAGVSPGEYRLQQLPL